MISGSGVSGLDLTSVARVTIQPNKMKAKAITTCRMKTVKSVLVPLILGFNDSITYGNQGKENQSQAVNENGL